MTDSFVTQCPHCQTSFRITRAQLGAAHGAVRCGACMKVFNAAQQMLVDQNRAQKPAPAPEPPRTEPPIPQPAYPAHPVGQQAMPVIEPAAKQAATKQSVDTVWIHDDLDLDNLDLDEELAKLEEQEMQLSRDFLAIEASSPSAIAKLRDDDDNGPAHDEAWAETLLREENRKAEQEEEAGTIRYTPPLAASREDDDEIEAIEAETERTEPTFDSADTTPDDEVEPVQMSRRSEPGLRNDHLLDFDREPLQLDWQEERKPWGRWLGWGLLNLLAILALGGQYVVYHFEELARQDDYRPLFQQICPEIGCQLPSKVDIEQIKSSNLVVRSHPDFRNSLVVDAIIYNRAAFAQPFPLLELRFADINGQLLASRRFKPSEYLGGELAGQSEMPPQTPIHVSLEILDPGAKAVNYSLSFHSPE